MSVDQYFQQTTFTNCIKKKWILFYCITTFSRRRQYDWRWFPVVLDGRSFSLSLGLFFVFVLLAAGVRVMCFRPSVVAFLFLCFTYVFLYVTSVFFTSVFCVFRCGFVLGGCGGWRRRRFLFGGGRLRQRWVWDRVVVVFGVGDVEVVTWCLEVLRGWRGVWRCWGGDMECVDAVVIGFGAQCVGGGGEAMWWCYCCGGRCEW
jgi:hypothetical protein